MISRKSSPEVEIDLEPKKIDPRHQGLIDQAAVVIPAMVVAGTYREKNLKKVINHLVWSGFSRDQIHTPSPRKGDDFRKGSLITRATKKAGKKYLLQVDADIIHDWGGFFDWVAENQSADRPLLPFNGFLKSTRDQADATEVGEISIKGCFPRDRFLRARCAGGFWIPTDLYLENPIKDVFVGWGCEDIEFANRIAKIIGWERSDAVALHLWHEYDRKMNLDNLDHSTSCNREKADWNRIRQRFVVLCPRRSGSNLLERSLDNHPDIEMFHGEPFGVTDPGGRSKNAENPAWWILRYIKTNANTFGFRLMDHDPKHHDRDWLLSNLLEHGWKFIRLHREDTFAQLASFWLAKEERNWINLPYETEICTMDPEWAKTHIDLMRAYEEQTMKFLIDIPRDSFFRLRYEDMANDFDGAMAAVQDFLGTRQVRLEQGMKKQMTRDPRRIIKNHLEIEKLI